jgi:3-oxoacyl-[acyl-carrier-protein] synthase-1/3-oxoacyl-[acyl-carrier-protein] synthase II
MKPLAPVSITGMGCLCAAGADVETCMKFLFKGERHPAPPSGFSIQSAVSYPVFEAPDDFFAPSMFRDPPGVRASQLLLTAVLEALNDAEVSRDILKEKRVGVCIGTNVGGSISNKDISGRNENRSPSLLPFERFLAASPVYHVTREFELSGPFQTIVNACSAGADAIGIGASWIRSGLCDMVIAGGADALYKITYMGFISLMNSDDGPCKPFDVQRKGLNLGEGAGVMILESEEMRQERKKSPRAFVRGYGSGTDAFHFTAPAPDGRGLMLAIEEAAASSGIAVSDLAFINAHGTGTPNNDLIESQVFAEKLPGIPFFSTKGYVGHTLGAAGAIEAIFTIGCLEQKRIPLSAGFTDPDPDLPVSPVREITPVQGSSALSDTLAFGGNNAVLILSLERGAS